MSKKYEQYCQFSNSLLGERCHSQSLYISVTVLVLLSVIGSLQSFVIVQNGSNIIFCLWSYCIDLSCVICLFYSVFICLEAFVVFHLVSSFVLRRFVMVFCLVFSSECAIFSPDLSTHSLEKSCVFRLSCVSRMSCVFSLSCVFRFSCVFRLSFVIRLSYVFRLSCVFRLSFVIRLSCVFRLSFVIRLSCVFRLSCVLRLSCVFRFCVILVIYVKVRR